MSRVVEREDSDGWELRIGRPPFRSWVVFFAFSTIVWAAMLGLFLRWMYEASEMHFGGAAAILVFFAAMAVIIAVRRLAYFVGGDESLHLHRGVLVLRRPGLAVLRRLRVDRIRTVRILPQQRGYRPTHRIAISCGGREVCLGLDLEEQEARQVADRLRLALGLLDAAGRPREC